ncbi:hypothetical protein BC939DRAFT_460337 [Gamsiella multidivaricata]|uniref:uncharacterized protein n=1 Tax=Gamsiella multidivaricata TaxID=101098 RepID=UPI00221E44DD|nr:uncharacterized protein BC939DRAFT_460337 [Gamsiella multidivaricata]KAI7819292.1 hypothetical protein BC939DRAFT_460337 [Gamsiella multidivaricata]
MKRRRSAERWEPDELKPDPRSDFSSLLNVQVGSQITTKHPGQVPKYFGQGYQGNQFFVTEQMMEIWQMLASDTKFPVKKVLSGPMGVGKSYLAWFLAAQAYANGWLVLYVSDASRLNQDTAERASIEICKRFLAINKDILTAAELKEMVTYEDRSTPLVVSIAGTILGSLLQRRERKSLYIIDEHGALFASDPPAPDRLVLLLPLQSFNCWEESAAGARVIFTGTAHAKFERAYLIDGTHLIYVGPLSPAILGRLQAGVFSHFDSTVRDHVSDIEDEVLRITNCVPRELVNLAQEIGTAPLTLKEIKEKLDIFEERRRHEFKYVAESHYNSLPRNSKDGTRLALAQMFLPSKDRPTAIFNWRFLDFGMVYQYLSSSEITVFYSPICPAAKAALLDLYKLCPLPESYRYGLAQDNLDGEQFEDALFQQLIRTSGSMLETTDLVGKNAVDIHLKISGYELLQEPPRNFGKDGLDILIRCYAGYPRFDFLLGYTFFQRKGGKNQIEEYLDAMFGDVHKADINLNCRGGNNYTKTFVVSRDGRACPLFSIVYICGRPGATNHPSKAQEYPRIRHISYEEIKSKFFGVSLPRFSRIA